MDTVIAELLSRINDSSQMVAAFAAWHFNERQPTCFFRP
jgi:hypothetical protein